MFGKGSFRGDFVLFELAKCLVHMSDFVCLLAEKKWPSKRGG